MGIVCVRVHLLHVCWSVCVLCVYMGMVCVCVCVLCVQLSTWAWCVSVCVCVTVHASALSNCAPVSVIVHFCLCERILEPACLDVHV